MSEQGFIFCKKIQISLSSMIEQRCKGVPSWIEYATLQIGGHLKLRLPSLSFEEHIFRINLFTIFDRWSRKINAITGSCLLIAVISVNYFKILFQVINTRNHRNVKSKIGRYTNFEMVIFLYLFVSLLGQVLFVKASSNIFLSLLIHTPIKLAYRFIYINHNLSKIKMNLQFLEVIIYQRY